MNINWQVISTFDLKKCNFEMLQFQMSNIYGTTFSESTRSNYMKFLNIMQMIIFYNEYCNLQLNETNQQIDRDIAAIDDQIAKQEAKLLKSKKHIQKCRQFRSDLKKIKVKPNIVYGCLYCNLEFKDTLTLDRHMEVHKKPPNLLPQILVIQKELQAQLALVYETKQQRRQLQFMKEDLNCGMLAAAERNQQLLSDEKLKGLIQTYEQKVKKLQDLLYSLDERAVETKIQYNDEWLDEIKNEINEELTNKREEEKLVERQLAETTKQLKKSQTKVLNKQNSIVMKGRGQFSQSEMKYSQSQLKSLAYIQSQEGGANHRFTRNRQEAKNQYSDDEVLPNEEIIIEEEDQSPNPREHHQRENSSQIQYKSKHSKNQSDISILPSETTSKQGMTTFEKYELRQKEFNKLVCDILQNRYFLRRTQFSEEELQRERTKLERKLEKISSEGIENRLQQLRLENKEFANRKRYQIKIKKPTNQFNQENEARENTITTLESSNDEAMSEKKSDDDEKEGPQVLTELGKFPFSVDGNKEQHAKLSQEEEHSEQPKGYGVNAFSLNF